MKEPVIVSPAKYLAVFVALMALLALTYLLAHEDLGALNTPMSLLIAAVKALLVIFYFMHIRYSRGLHRLFWFVGVFWLGIMLALTLTDYSSRDWLLMPGKWPG